MKSQAAPKHVGSPVRQSLLKAVFIFGASACLTLFLAAPGLAFPGGQSSAHGGSSSGGGGSHSGGSGGASSRGYTTGATPVAPAPAHVARASGGNVSGSAERAPAGSGFAVSGNSGTGGGALVDSRSSAPTGVQGSAGGNGEMRSIFVDSTGRVLSSPGNPPVGSYLWGGPQQQQQGHPAAPPRPAPMPVAPAPRPAPMPVAPTMRPPIMQMPAMRSPVQQIPMRPMPMQPRPIPIPSPNPNTHPIVIPPSNGRPIVLPIKQRPGFVGTTPSTALPVPPQMKHVQLQPVGGGKMFNSSTSYVMTPTPVPPRFCADTFGGCGVEFQRNFGSNDFGFNDFDFGFGDPFFFAFGGPFGFGVPCIFNGFTLECIGTGWNGPFGLGWGTPWGYNPGTGSLYPIGPYLSPTPAEMNEASVNALGPTSFLPPEPAQLTPVPPDDAFALAQPAAILVLKDGTEFGVTSYWLQDNKLYYVTTYNIQSSIPIDPLDLQTTVDLNYKRGVTFTLTPKPQDQQPQDQPPLLQ